MDNPWIRNYMSSKEWGEITYPFPNFNGGTVEVWEWISNFIPHFTVNVIFIQAEINHVSKKGPRLHNLNTPK